MKDSQLQERTELLFKDCNLPEHLHFSWRVDLLKLKAKLPPRIYESITSLVKKYKINEEFVRRFFVCFFDRYPSHIEINNICLHIEMNDYQFFIDYLTASIEFRYKVKYYEYQKVVVSDPNTWYIDATHTMSTGHTTGIQRVVKKQIIEWKKQNKPIQIIKISPYRGAEVANEREVQNLLEQTQHVIQRTTDLLKYPYLRVLLRYILRKLSVFSRFTSNYLRINLLIRLADQAKPYFFPLFNSKAESTNGTLIYFNDAKVFTAELFTDHRVEFYRLNHECFKKSGVVIHDFIPLLNLDVTTTDALATIFNKYVRVLLNFSHVTTVSNCVANDLINYLHFTQQATALGFNGKIKPILLGSDPLLQIEPNTEVTNNENSNFILSVHTIEPRKNIINVLHAYSSLWFEGINLPKYILVGKLGWKYEEIILWIEYYKKQGVPVSVLNNIDDNELSKLYKNAKFTVFCSILEGYGLPIVESLLYQKPVLTSNIGSMKELAENHGGCVCVNPYSVEEIKEGFLKILDGNIPPIKANSIKSWSQYSEELYTFLES